MKKKLTQLTFLFLGLFSLLTQTILIREFFISFQGNEIAIGVFYASWFFWIAVGASLIIIKKKLADYFLKFLIFYPVLALIQLMLFRALRGIANVEVWEFFIFQKALPLSIILNTPLSLFTGIIFTSGCEFFKKRDENYSTAVSKAYIFESLGSFLAGILITVLLIRLTDIISILLFSSFIFLIISFLNTLYFKDKLSRILAIFVLILYALLIFNKTSLTDQLNYLRFKYILPQATLLEEINTPYQHLSVAKLKDQIIILSNGKISQTLPNKISADGMAALFIAMADMPKKILILGEFAENYISSLLDFPINSLTYVFKDKDYLGLVKKHAPTALSNIFSDERLQIVFQDSRHYLMNSENIYDLIIVNYPDPKTASLNKYYTAEFYQLCRKRLTKNGAIGAKITSAENFIGTEIKNYGSSIYYSLKSEFEKIAIIPGSTNWFFAGGENSLISQNPEILAERYRKYTPIESSFYPDGFYSLILMDRVEFLEQTYLNNPIFKNTGLVNSDKKPLSYFLNILVLGRYSDSFLVKMLKPVFFSGWILFIFPIILLLALRLHYLKFIENTPCEKAVFNSKAFQLFSGTSAFTYHIVLLFLFQNKFGTLFQLIGFISALFMLGLLLGSILSIKLINRYRALKLMLSVISIQFLLYVISFPLLERVLPYLSKEISFIVYMLLFLSSGLLAGASYPLAGKVLEKQNIKLLNLAGFLESLDHWGASIGAILTGIILIPLLGIYKTLILLAVICLGMIFLIGMEVFKISFKEKALQPQKLSFPYIKISYLLFAVSAWSIFTFNYIEREKDSIEEEPHSITLFQNIIQLDEVKQKDTPFTHYIGYREDKTYYIFQSKDLNTTSIGFGGEIDIILIIDEEQIIQNISITSSNETPDYLEKIETWLENFKGLNISQFLPERESIDAVTSATFTSNAVIDSVKESSQKIESIFSKTSSFKKESMPIKNIPESIILLIFTVLGIVLFHSCKSLKIRRIYFIFLILIIGFKLQLQFSYFHIFNIFSLNLPPLKNLSLFLMTFLPLGLGIFYGRIYCGWLCPFGALQELICCTKTRFKAKENLDNKARYIKYVLLALIIIVVAVTRNIRIHQGEPLSEVFTILSKPDLKKTLLYLTLFFSIFFFRFWCRYFCITGALLSLFNKIALFKWVFRKKISNCDIDIKNLNNLDCFLCNRCLENEE
ncbi:MAG: FMN-binding protein [Candidatus Saelkia tenebricola]|nr:FMN-binding protein [Candidatus Saelkia tenebricola]